MGTSEERRNSKSKYAYMNDSEKYCEGKVKRTFVNKQSKERKWKEYETKKPKSSPRKYKSEGVPFA